MENTKKEVFSVLRLLMSFEKQYELLTLNLLSATKVIMLNFFFQFKSVLEGRNHIVY